MNELRSNPYDRSSGESSGTTKSIRIRTYSVRFGKERPCSLLIGPASTARQSRQFPAHNADWLSHLDSIPVSILRACHWPDTRWIVRGMPAQARCGLVGAGLSSSSLLLFFSFFSSFLSPLFHLTSPRPLSEAPPSTPLSVCVGLFVLILFSLSFCIASVISHLFR